MFRFGVLFLSLLAVTEISAYIETDDSYHLFADASFLYWQPSQDNMEIGLALDSVVPVFSGGFPVAWSTESAKYVNMDFDFLPGFKIGMGAHTSYDRWDFSLEYTRLHGADRKRSSGGAFGLAPSFAPSEAMQTLLGSSATFFYGPGKASWNIKLDILDAHFGRFHFTNPRFSLHLFVGLREAWIRQKLHGFYFRSTPNFSFLNSVSNLLSWAIGPSCGLDGSWAIGKGFRVFGSGEGDVLYTGYRWQYKSEASNPVAAPAPVLFVTKNNGIHALRGHVDFELGLAWGSSFANEKWRFDGSLGYGFQVFFNQNMFHFYHITSNSPIGYLPSGNLYVQGLTMKAKAEF